MCQIRRARGRPVLITIAAILLLLLGGVQLLLAVTEFFRNNFGALAPLEDNSQLVWGSLDVLFAIVLIYAGYALLQWHAVGRTLALLVTVLLAFRWANYVVNYQWVTLALVVACGLIIAALAWSGDPIAEG